MFRLILCVVFLTFSTGFVSASPPPPMPSFTFSVDSTMVIPGDGTARSSGWQGNRGVLADQVIGNLSLVAADAGGGGDSAHYTDGQYNHRDFRVERGRWTGGLEVLEAYRVHPSSARATKFLASHHILVARFSRSRDYKVWAMDSTGGRLVAAISSDRIRPGAWTEIPEFDASLLTEAVTLIFLPTDTDPPGLARLGPGIRGASLAVAPGLTAVRYNYEVGKRVPDARVDYPHGPAAFENIFGDSRDYEFVSTPDGDLGVVWQDPASGGYFLTWVGPDRLRLRNLELRKREDQLAAATSDPAGRIYFVEVQSGDGAGSRDTARRAWLVRVGVNGREEARVALDTGTRGLNIVSFRDEPFVLGQSSRLRNGAVLRWSAGQLGLMMSRTLHKSADGLNHQSGLAAVFDAESLSLIKYHGQTSGHSQDQVLTLSADGAFLGVDLGDNYPRGVNVHRFDSTGMKSELVFTLKTAHGEQPTTPAGRRFPEYTALSTPAQRLYQWSNDNRVYSELGGVVDAGGDWWVAFAVERSPEGATLDPRRARGEVNDSRNLALMRLRPPLTPRWSEVNVIRPELIVEPGPEEKGGFYDFGGGWQPQRNYAPRWITDYRDPNTSNVSRVKMVRLADGSLLLAWERWSQDTWQDTLVQVLDSEGRTLAGPVYLGAQLRLHRRDDPFVQGNTVWFVAGSGADGRIDLFGLTWTGR